ncbi:hypothetical protein N7676_19390 [Stenotrophomonas sp. GD03993]|uniref:hypothetical protein n=1 Tax=unclassified Stenotrophomonas TaxID=196198 RepID=UPI0013122B40|nr:MULTISPECIES: hypothetical protein [unclassified Stenotrophomonas]MDH0189125.1 hypothetical protein [Stenotrophomonas sp. GD04051]MDH0465971.1 hypothetical protein [Stenotrophomonas sp. GD03993]MDH0876621.1 hypothetical protein [Stenotrophomonas sp. GD03877]MDH2157381.1 hypothetical protein [Stenotrophomonas sp. GD03657]
MNRLPCNPNTSDFPDFEPNTTESRRKHVRFWLRCLADRGEQPDARIHVALERYVEGGYDLHALSRAVIAPYLH